MKKGFTLIELLAVIVILAVILLITIPRVYNIIKGSKNKTDNISVEAYAKAVKNALLSYETSVGRKAETIEELKPYIEYDGNKVECKIEVINSDSTIYLDRCKVSGEEVDYTYGQGEIPKVIQQLYEVAKTDKDDSIFMDEYGNIRYRGITPSNYIRFNEETWRIIGYIDGYVKLIRNEPIGRFSWDTTGGPEGLNNWTRPADLMRLLNPQTYDNNVIYESDDLVNSSLYWNSESGECYNGRYGAKIECDFTGEVDGKEEKIKGLSEESREMIALTTWNLGVATSSETRELYEQERKGSSPWERLWEGYVGLMYPSDYGYASSSSECSSNLFKNTACKSVNWLSTYAVTLLTPSTSDHASYGMFSGGGLDVGAVFYSAEIRPVINLKSTVKITGGTGTLDDYFQIG